MEGLHLMCFGCGRHKAFPINPAVSTAPQETETIRDKGTFTNALPFRRDPDFVSKTEVTDSYDPWMLAT